MKKWLLGMITAFTLLASTSGPVFADVLRTGNQTSGRPYAADSNPGSSQATVHRSTTGTTQKFTNDRYEEIW